MIEVLTTDAFKKTVFDYDTHQDWIFEKNKPIILNFFAPWCGPCNMFAPTLDDIAQEHADRLEVYKIDIDATPELAALFGVRSVPTTLFLKPKHEPFMTSGALPRESVERAITELFNPG